MIEGVPGSYPRLQARRNPHYDEFQLRMVHATKSPSLHLVLLHVICAHFNPTTCRLGDPATRGDRVRTRTEVGSTLRGASRQ